MRGWLLTGAVLLVVAVGADRAALVLTERGLAEQARTSGGLGQTPDVSIAGFPFLTQALAGRYDDVRLQATGGVDVGGLSGAGLVQVAALDVRLTGVEVPLRDVLSGAVDDVPVASVRGDVLLGYGELSRRAPRGVTVSAAGERLRVTGTVRVLGRDLSASALSDVVLADGSVVVRAREVEAGGARVPLGVLSAALDFAVPVGDLPYGLALTGLRVRPDGVGLTARSGPTVLRR